MHANLNKTARKMWPKDWKKEKRENHEQFCIIYWNFVAQTKKLEWGAGRRTQDAGRPRTKLHEMCFYFLALCRSCLTGWPDCWLHGCMAGIILWLVCIYFSFAWIFHCFHRRSAVHFTLRRIRTNTRYLSAENQLLLQISPASYIDIHNGWSSSSFEKRLPSSPSKYFTSIIRQNL